MANFGCDLVYELDILEHMAKKRLQ